MKLPRTCLAAVVLCSTLAIAGDPRFEGAIFSDDKRSDVNMESFSRDTKRIYRSLDRPSIGWPPGEYEVELAIDGKVQSTVRFKVAP